MENAMGILLRVKWQPHLKWWVSFYLEIYLLQMHLGVIHLWRHRNLKIFWAPFALFHSKMTVLLRPFYIASQNGNPLTAEIVIHLYAILTQNICFCFSAIATEWACNDYVNKQTKFRNQPWYAIEIDLKLLNKMCKFWSEFRMEKLAKKSGINTKL